MKQAVCLFGLSIAFSLCLKAENQAENANLKFYFNDNTRYSADRTYQIARAGDSEAHYAYGSVAWAMKDDVAGQIGDQ